MPPQPRPVIIGESYGSLVVVKETSRGDDGARRIICQCTLCDSEKIFRLASLKSGDAKSCGCQKVKHGMAKKNMPEYEIWKTMRVRCNNPNSQKYYLYGAKGIKVCERWNDFSLFLADIGPRPSKEYSLDRYPNRDGNYEPGNCRWATAMEQSRNRDYCKVIVFNGVERQIVELAEEYGIDPFRVHRRLEYGWSIERALTTPVRIGNNGSNC